MADIAMLVAEEYERRVRISRKSGADGEEINFFSAVSGLGRGLEGSINLMKLRFGEEKVEVVKPKTHMGVAAINGFFSA